MILQTIYAEFVAVYVRWNAVGIFHLRDVSNSVRRWWGWVSGAHGMLGVLAVSIAGFLVHLWEDRLDKYAENTIKSTFSRNYEFPWIIEGQDN